MFSIQFKRSVFSCLLTVVLAPAASAHDVLLTSWHNFSAGYQFYRYSDSPKSSDDGLSNVSGNLWGGNGAREEWGATDGTYGSTLALRNSEVDGGMALRTDRDFIEFTVINGTAGNLELSRVLFDFASVKNNSPRNLKLFDLNGGLNIPDRTLIAP